MKQVSWIIALPLLALIQSCSDSTCVKGSGIVSEYEISVNEFDKISLIGIMNLEITQGSEQAVSIIAESEIFTELSYAVTNQHLKFDFDADCIDTDIGVTVRITVPDITYVSVDGEGSVVSIGDLSLDHLEMEVFGVGDVSLLGTASHLTYKVEGTANVHNFNLTTASTSIDIFGTGNLEVNCTDLLNIDVEGSGDISYKGQPQIIQNVSGALKLTNAN